MEPIIRQLFATHHDDDPTAELLQAIELPDMNTVVALSSETVEGDGVVKESDLTPFGALCYYGAPGEKPWVRWTEAARLAAGYPPDEDEPA